MLPEKSQTSLTKGLWFVHDDEVNSIKIFGSNTGKEKIYLNEELVSEQRNVNLKSEHQFQDKQGNIYEVKFITTNLVKGEMDCLIYKNKERIKSFKTSFRRGKFFTLKEFLILILSSVTFAILNVSLNWPDFALYIFITTLLIIHFANYNPGEIIIEETEE